jgi:hypothetical protein
MKAPNGFLVLFVALSSLGPAPASAAEPPAAVRWIVTAGRGAGAAGEQYYSTLDLLNPNAVDATVEVSFLPQSPLDASGNALGDNSGAPARTFLVPAGGNLRVDTFWTQFGDAGNAGAIRVVPTGTDAQGNPLSVVPLSRTSGVKQDPYREFRGPLIVGQGPATLLGAGETGRVPLLETGQSLFTSYRSNLFLLSTSREAGTVVELTLLDAAGESRGTRTITLGRLSQTQVNDVGRYFGYQTCAHGCPSGSPYPETFDVLVRVVSGGPVAAGGVVIEAENGSSIYVEPVKVAAP